MPTCCNRNQVRYGSQVNQFRRMQIIVLFTVLCLLGGGLSEDYYEDYYEGEGPPPPPCPYRCSCTEVEVDCSNAYLSYLPYTISTSIQRLIISGNSIPSIDSITSRGFHSLLYIDASSNPISSLDWSSFASMTSLEELYLQTNNLFIMDLSHFHNSNLRFLNVSGNKLVSIVMGATQLPVQRLYIQDCGLTLFNLGASSSLSELEILHAGGNSFSSLPNGAFTRMTKLKELKLDNCGLSSLSENTFSSNIELEILDLSQNHIVSLPDGIFPTSLRRLNLSGNRWHCDCNLMWLKIFMESLQATGGIIENESSTTCTYSEEVSYTITGTAAYTFSGCSGSEQLHRFARSAIAISSLPSWQATCATWQRHNPSIDCGPEKAASCVYDFPSESYMLIQYSPMSQKASLNSDCRDRCLSQESLYFIYDSSLPMCLCSNQTVSSQCSDCSTASKDSPTLCNGQFSNVLGASSIMYDAQIEFQPDTLKTNTRVMFSLTGGVAAYDTFSWNFGDGSPATGTSSANTVYHTFLYPGEFKMKLFVSSSTNSIPPFQMNLNLTVTTPVDPGELICPTGLVSTYQSIDIRAQFTTAWNQGVKWSRTDDSQNSSPGNYEYEGECDGDWIPFRNRCVLPVLTLEPFVNAKATCSQMGGNLVRPHSEEEIECLTSNTQLFPTESSTLSFYTDAQWNSNLNNYRWSSGDKAFIDKDSMTSAPDKSCIAVDKNGLKGVDCNVSLAALCEKDPIICLGRESSRKTCYVYVSQSATWEQADAWCRANYTNGMLATIYAQSDNYYVKRMISNSSWLGLQATLLEGHYAWSSGELLTGLSYWATDQGSETCVVMQSGGQWITASCSNTHEFICEYFVGDELTAQHLVTGLSFIPLGNESLLSLASSSSSVTSSSPSTTVVLPGTWFHTSGSQKKLYSLLNPVNDQTKVAFHVWRPVCQSGTLQRPGCLNDSPLYKCNPARSNNNCRTVNCGIDSFFCPLTQSCHVTSQPCTCSTNTVIPNINCSIQTVDSNIPLYTLTHVAVVDVPAGESAITLDVDIDVSEGDIVGFQSERPNHIRCDSNSASEWAHPKVELVHPSWVKIGDSITLHNGVLQNQALCYVSAVYVTTQSQISTPSFINYLTAPGSYSFSVEPVPDTNQGVPCTITTLDNVEGFQWIYPIASSLGRDNSSGMAVTVNVISGIPYTLVVKLLRGSNADIKWTVGSDVPVSTTMQGNCPSSILSPPKKCQYETSFLSNPYSSLSYTFEYNPLPVEIMVNASNEISSRLIRVFISAHEQIDNVTIFHSDCTSRMSCEVTVEVKSNETFFVDIESKGVEEITLTENGVVFASGFTNITQFSRKFQIAGIYTLQVNVSNVVSFMNSSIIVNAYQIANFTNVRFISDIGRAAVGVPVNITASAKVALGSFYMGTWNIGSFSSTFRKTSADATTITPTLTNYVFTELGIQTVLLQLEDAFGNNVTISMTVHVFQRINSILLFLDSPYVATEEDFVLGIIVDNTTQITRASHGDMRFIVDFGDGSTSEAWNDTNANQEITHSFASPGNFTITVRVYSYYEPMHVVLETIRMEALEAICKLSLKYDGPKHVNDTVTFQASVGCGTNVTYSLDCGDRTVFDFQTGVEFTHIYNQAAVYEAKLVAQNAVSKKQAKLTLYAYDENLLQIIKVAGRECIALNQSYHVRAEVAAEHPDRIHFDWNFGNSLTQKGDGLSNVHTTYGEIGLFYLTLLVTHPTNNKTDSHAKEVCVEERITGINVTFTSPVALRPPEWEESVYFFASVDAGSNLTFSWDSDYFTGLDSADNYLLTVNRAGNFSIRLRISNDIGHESEIVYLVVEEVITGLGINCPTCSNTKYTIVGGNTTFLASVVNGTDQKYEWNFTDSSMVLYGATVNYTFLSSGQYTVSLLAWNEVSQNNTSFNIVAQDAITDVILQTNESFIEVNKIVKFSVTFQKGSDVSISWQCTNKTNLQGNVHEILLSFSTTGYYICSVTLENFVSSQTATHTIPVIEAISDLSIGHNFTLDSNQNKYAAVGEVYVFSIQSNTFFLVTFSWAVTRNGMLLHSGAGLSTTFICPADDDYTLTLNARNDINSKEVMIPIRCHEKVVNASLIANSSTENKVLLGESLEFRVIMDSGTAVRFEWKQDGQSVVLSGDTLQLLFSQTGESRISCDVSNVFGSYMVDVLVIVLEPVSGISIHSDKYNSSQPYVQLNEPMTFSAPNIQGTNISYRWTLLNVFSGQDVIYTTPNFTHEFPSAGSYSLTLRASNARSVQEMSSTVEVQAPVTQLQLIMSDTTVATNTSVHLMASVNSNSTNVTFTWVIDGTTTEIQNLTESFSVSGSYRITLKAANNVSSKTETEVLVVMDPVRKLQLQNFTSVIRGLVNVVFQADVESGSNLSYSWEIEIDGQNDTLSGEVVSYVFQRESYGRVYLLAENAISRASFDHAFEVQLPIQNVEISITYPDPEYIFPNKDTVFTVSGDNLMFADFQWTILPLQATYVSGSSLNISFADLGNYTASVAVRNDINEQRATLDFSVKLFQCELPILSRVGSISQTVMRSHVLELEVAVDPRGCTLYLAVHSWVVFKADDCGGDLNLAEEVDLGDTPTSSPALIIQPRVLETGNYCIRFTTGYHYKPVSLSMKYSVTVEGSHLTAVIRGGTVRTVALGENFCMDGDLSFDPDIGSGSPNLSFQWECVQLTTSGGCFQPSTSSRYCYQGFQVGKYKIRLHVSAPQRVGDIAEQTIDVLNLQEFLPVASIVCESCATLGNYGISASQHVALSAACENCQCEPTFSWQIYEGHSQIPLTLRDNDTTTGVNDQNLVLKKWGPFSDLMDYTFVVSVSCSSVSAHTGTASLNLSSNAPPRGGQCVFSPTEIIPLEDQLTVSCPNWFDIEDPNTLITYQIEVDSLSSTNGQPAQVETYVLYTGTDATQSVYLGSFNGESVTLRVLIADEYGATVVGAESFITFRNATYNSTSKLDYLINQTDNVLSALIKQAAPTSLLQYAIALCQQLNAESEYEHTIQTPGSGTSSEQSRATVRDALTISLTTSVPISTLGDINQMSFAMRLLTEYSTEYLTEGCQILIIQTMERMAIVLQNLSSNGLDRNDIPTSNLLIVLKNVISAVNARVYSSYGVWNSGRLYSLNNLTTDFRTLRPEISSRVNGLDLTDVTLDESHRQSVTSTAVALLESVLVATLQSMMVNEKSIELELDGLKVKALRTFAKNMMQEDVSTSSQITFSPSILYSVKNGSDEIFQTLISHSANPYTYGYTSYLAITMPVQTLSFHEINGTAIQVRDLDVDSRPNFLTLNNADNISSPITAGLLNESSIYDPLENVVYKKTNISARQAKEWKIPNTSTYVSGGGGLHIQIRMEFLTNENGATPTSTVNVYMGINNKPTSDSHNQAMTLTEDLMASGTDHRRYTVFVSNLRSTDEVFIRAENNDNLMAVELSVAVYFSYCQYFDVSAREWSSEGCMPMDESIASVTVCQCNHLTSFGSSGFVSISDINFEDLGKLDLVTNPFVFIVVAAILVVYILMAILCRYLDGLDLRRISHVPLCGRDGPYKYEITVVTGRMYGSGTSAHVGMKLYGEVDKGEARHLTKPGAFQHNCADTFLVAFDANLGNLTKILVWHDNTGLSPCWYLSHVIVKDVQTGAESVFVINSWLSLEMKDGVVQKTVKKADEDDVRKFKLSFASVFFQKFSDFHLWFSVSHRPDHSRFTRFQRATVCLTAVYMYMCVNAMWYGLIKSANDANEDLNVNSFGWEEVIIALASAAIILPFVFGLMFLFKKTRCKESLFQEVLRPSTAQTIEIEAVCDMSHDGMSMRTVTPLGDWIQAIDRESTTDSLPAPSDLKRTAPMHKGKHRQNSNNTIKVKPAVPGGGKQELWNEDNIMQNWPHKMPTWIKEVKADVKVKNKNESITKKWADDDDDLDRQLDEVDAQIAKDEEKQRQRQLQRRKRVGADDLFDSDDEWVNDDLDDVSTKEDKGKSAFNPRGEAELIPSGTRSKIVDTSGGNTEALKSNKLALKHTWRDVAGPSFLSLKSRSNTHTKDMGRARTMSTLSQSAGETSKQGFSLPPWFTIINYTICFILCVVSLILVILYGYEFGSSVAVKWLVSLIFTLLISVLFLEPLKVLALSIIVTWITKDQQHGDLDLIDIKPNVEGNEQIKDVKFKPLGGFALLQAKEEGKKKQRLHTLMRELIIFTFMFTIFLATVYVNYWNSSIYHTNANILTKFQNSSSGLNVSDLKSINDYWNWTKESLASSIHLEMLNEVESFGHLMGPAWLRQVRSETVSCPVTTYNELDSGRCVDEANDNPDTQNYLVGWVNPASSLYNYTFSSASQLDMFSKFGQWLLYQGGGYIQRLGTSYNDTLEVLSSLQSDGWVDLRTRAVFMEVSLYNPSDGFASCVTVLTEFPISGGVLTQITVSTEKLLRFTHGVVDPLLVCEVLFTPFIIYFLVTFAFSLKREGIRYFTHFWSWVDMWICILSTTCLGLYITCVSMATKETDAFLNNQSQPANLFTPVLYHSLLRYIQAILLFLFHLKIVKQIRFARPLYKFYVALAAAKGSLAGVFLIFVILLFGYANVTHLLYVSLVAGYRNYGNAITSLFGVICGPTTFTPLFEAERVLTHFVFLSFGLFVYGLTVSLVVAVLSFSYKRSRSQMSYKTSLEARDYEMIDFFIKRFKVITGIEKPKPAFRHVKFEGLPSLPSRGTSSNLSSRQSCQSPTSGSSDSSHLDLSSQSLDYLMAALLPTWDQVSQSFQKIEELDKQEEDLTRRLQDAAKTLSHSNRHDQSQAMQLKVFSAPTIVGKPPLDPKATFSHTPSRNSGRKPTLLRGRASMTPPSTFASDSSYEKRSHRPFSDQGVRSDPQPGINPSLKPNGSAHERGSPGPGFYSKISTTSQTNGKQLLDMSKLEASSTNGKPLLDVAKFEHRLKPKQREAWKPNT